MSTWFVRHPEENDLALFAGGELGPVARWRIEGHLHGCEDCRQTVSEFFELRSRVNDLAELPHLDWAGMAEHIQRRVERERTRTAAPVWRPVWSAAVALVLLVVAGVYVAQHHAPPGPVLDASSGGVELRLGTDQVLSFINAAQAQANSRVTADAVSARYFDKDTGNITVTNVYAQ